MRVFHWSLQGSGTINPRQDTVRPNGQNQVRHNRQREQDANQSRIVQDQTSQGSITQSNQLLAKLVQDRDTSKPGRSTPPKFVPDQRNSERSKSDKQDQACGVQVQGKSDIFEAKFNRNVSSPDEEQFKAKAVNDETTREIPQPKPEQALTSTPVQSKVVPSTTKVQDASERAQHVKSGKENIGEKLPNSSSNVPNGNQKRPNSCSNETNGKQKLANSAFISPKNSSISPDLPIRPLNSPNFQTFPQKLPNGSSNRPNVEVIPNRSKQANPDQELVFLKDQNFQLVKQVQWATDY